MKNVAFFTKMHQKKSLSFDASANNTGLLVQCEECKMWRLVHALRKLFLTDKRKLSKFLEEHAFTCGADLSDLDLTDNLSSVCVRT